MVDREQAMVNGIGSKTSVQGWSCREKVLAVLLGIGHFIRTFHNIIMAVAVRFAFFITGIALVLSLLIVSAAPVIWYLLYLMRLLDLCPRDLLHKTLVVP